MAEKYIFPAKKAQDVCWEEVLLEITLTKAVISLENIQIRRYALEPVGSVFLGWCLMIPSRFFCEFVGTLEFRYALILELYPDSVFWFGIGWYFPSIFPSDTKRKLSRDVLVLYIWREPPALLNDCYHLAFLCCYVFAGDMELIIAK